MSSRRTRPSGRRASDKEDSEEHEIPEIAEAVLKDLVGRAREEILFGFLCEANVVGDDVVDFAVQEAGQSVAVVDGPDADLFARGVRFRNAGVADTLFLEEENVAV